MSKLLKRSSKTLLLLSCTSLLGSVFAVPLIHATEVMSQISSSETPVEENKDVYTFTMLSEEIVQTRLFDLPFKEKTLKGLTVPLSEVKVTFQDNTEQVTQSDELGEFTFTEISLAEKSQFDISIADQTGKVLETTTVTVNPNSPVTEETVAIEEPITEVKELEEEVIEIVVEEKVSEQTQEPVKTPELKESAVPEVKETPGQEVQTVRAFSTKTVPVDKTGTRYYYIYGEDTLYSISKKFDVAIEDLMRWNNIENASLIERGNVISINGMNDYKNFNKENIIFSSRTQFVDYISKYAKDIAPRYGLYPSVMIAQAAGETGYGTSDLSRKANNFFGIKANDDYQGYSIIMPTWEIVDGKRVDIEAAFRIYPTFKESLLDNAEKLSEGLSWDPYYYQGTWVSNTNNFKDATLYLTGRYATDDLYYSKLNNTIATYDLTKYDAKPYKDTSYTALITQTNSPIGNLPLDHLPKNHAGYGNIVIKANTKDYLGTVVTVSHVTKNGEYANIHNNNGEIGWVHTSTITTINSAIENVNYEAYFTSSKGKINSVPIGQVGTVLGNTGNHLNKKLHVTSQTKDGLQSYVTKDGQAMGWVLTSDLGNAVTPYTVIIKDGSHHVNNVPWGSPGYVRLSYTAAHTGKELEIIAKSKSGYLLVRVNGVVIGWVDARAIQPFTFTAKNYRNYVTSGKYDIDSLPWGTPGYKNLGKASKYYGKLVTITKESSNKAYVYIVGDGQDIGWIDKRALRLAGGDYDAVVTAGQYNVDSLPWGTPGYTKISLTAQHLGKVVQIAGATQDGSYLLMRINGRDIGWLDKRAVTRYDSVTVNYTAYITDGKYEIDTLPWGEKGFKKIGTTSKVLGNKVTITRESKNRAYAYAEIDGNPLGWIDKKAFIFKKAPYTAIIANGNYEVNNLPWGTTGSKLISHTNVYLGKKIEIAGATQSGSYLLARVDGKDIGWIDHRSVVSENVTAVNYNGKILNGHYEINSLPWGVKGFKYLGKTASLLGKDVQISLESSNKAYVYISVEGKPFGWIDKRAFK